MSQSINQLIKTLTSASNANPSAIEGELYNPDIPVGVTPPPPHVISDQYYNTMNINSNIKRNGSGYSLGPNRTVNKRHSNFHDEGAIMPETIRQQEDPVNAPPDDFVGGARGKVFALPKSAYVAHDNVGLIQKAHQNYVNYKNRYALPEPKHSPSNTPDQPESSVNIIRGGSLGLSTRLEGLPNDELPVGPDHEKFSTPFIGINRDFGPSKRGSTDTGVGPV